VAKRARIFQDLLAATSKLPWRTAVGLSILTFLALHLVADLFDPLDAAGDPAAGAINARYAVHVVAFVLQFILPIGFLGGVAVAVLNRVKAIRLLEAAPDDTPAAVKGIGWREFEQAICEAFRGEGFRVEERGRSGPDAQIDLIATKAKRRVLIQCKHWKAPQVGVALVRELSEIVAARRADGGALVTGGVFTKEARDLAAISRIRLIDGEAIQQMIGSAPPSPGVPSAPKAQAPPRPVSAPAPQCPKCGAGMIDRVAKQGKFAGRHFWGCSQFPKCTGIASATQPEQDLTNRVPRQASAG
jgi:restriction system protein